MGDSGQDERVQDENPERCLGVIKEGQNLMAAASNPVGVQRWAMTNTKEPSLATFVH